MVYDPKLIMALPAIPLIGKGIASAGVFEGARQGFRRVVPRARGAFNSLSQNARAALGLGAGATTGFGVNEIFTRLGIEDSRVQTLSIVAVAAIGLFGVGQLLDFNVDL